MISRRVFPWILQACALAGLAMGTGLWLVVFPAAAFLALSLLRKNPMKVHKAFAYGGVVPFVIWFILSPSEAVERIGSISIWVLWIPAWYFWYLGFLQYLMGEWRFVWWNSALVLALGLTNVGWNAVAVSLPWTIALAADIRVASVGNRIPWRVSFFVRWLLISFLVSMVWNFHEVLESQFWRYAFRGSGNYYQHSYVRGFEPNSWLGSFASEYESGRDRDVVIRVYSDKPFEFLRALTYDVYAGGIWKSPPLTQIRRPVRNMVEYSVFTEKIDVEDPQIWIQPRLKDFGYLFLPAGTQVIAAVADSLATDGRGIWRDDKQKHTGGYFVSPPLPETDIPRSQDLDIPVRLASFIDSIAMDWGLSPKLDSNQRILLQHFHRDFLYALKLSGLGGEDPLRSFFRTRKGYCEYFATASVLLLRSRGISARYATGFAYPSRQGKAWVFRRADAHAWVEVWNGSSWQPFDPTPGDYRPESETWGAWEAWQEGMSGRFSEWLRILQFGNWKLALDRITMWLQGLFSWRIVFGGILVLLGFAYLVRRRDARGTLLVHGSQKVWIRKLDLAEKRLAREGIVRGPAETVGEFLTRLPAHADLSARKDLEEYQAHRFQGTSKNSSA